MSLEIVTKQNKKDITIDVDYTTRGIYFTFTNSKNSSVSIAFNNDSINFKTFTSSITSIKYIQEALSLISIESFIKEVTLRNDVMCFEFYLDINNYLKLLTLIKLYK